MVASATANYLASHLNPGTILAGHASAALVQQSLVHGYVVGLLVDGGHLRGQRRGVRDAAAPGHHIEDVFTGNGTLRARHGGRFLIPGNGQGPDHGRSLGTDRSGLGPAHPIR